MGLFGKKERCITAASGIQTSRASVHPFSSLMAYVPLNNPQLRLYSALREAVPVIDAAILKLTRLTGGFRVECNDKTAEKKLSEFLRTVNVGGNQRGIESFISTYLEQLLTNGTALGEIVMSAGKIKGLYNASLENLDVKRRKNSLEIDFYKSGIAGNNEKIKYPWLILFSALNPDAESITGNSMLKGLPFISDILMKIYNTIGLNWDRVGNVRFSVNYKPAADALGDAEKIASQIASQWSEAMNNDSAVKDFVSVGDVEIKVIGADNQVLESDVPVRQMLEQIVAKTGLPPFMLGLSWSSTERMSAQQADVLTSELEAYRRILSPVIEKISALWLKLNGYSSELSIIWDDITLQDQVDIARARLYNAQAAALEKNIGTVNTNE
jgi:hypothetical protein